MSKIALPLVACLLAIATTGATAQSIWKWRDAAGGIHLSDTAPPPGTPVGNILQRPGAPVAPAPTSEAAVAPAGAPGPQASAPESDLQQKKARADRDKAARAAADKLALATRNEAVRRDNCQQAQAQAAALNTGARMARINANGEREFLDDAARGAEVKRARDIAAQNCGPAPDAP